MPADITAIILTKNEEVNIEECIKSIATAVKRIIVIDSYSTDRTVEIAKRMGAEVHQHPFENYAKQYMYGVEVAKAETVWTLRIDADERLTFESARELVQLCDCNMETDVAGIVLRFKKNFLGRDLYHGGVYPWKKMNCYKTKLGTIENRNMDEHIILSSAKVIEMKQDCLHFDFKNLEYFINKHKFSYLLKLKSVCLKASYKMIAAELERFRERPISIMGIVMQWSAFLFNISSGIPRDSGPNITKSFFSNLIFLFCFSSCIIYNSIRISIYKIFIRFPYF